MINHIVRSTQYKLAIISDGSSGRVSRQNGRIDRREGERAPEKEQPAAGLPALSFLSAAGLVMLNEPLLRAFRRE